MSSLFMLYIIFVCALNPKLAPAETDRDARTFAAKMSFTLSAIIPPGFLIFTVLGTLFLGLATPTEAAACGSVGVMLLAIIYRRMSWDLLFQAALQTVSITAMILAIVLAGSMFSGVFFASGGMAATKSILDAFGLSSWSVIAIILFVSFILGFIIDLISIVLIVVPIAFPLVKSFGVDPLWFAVVFLVMLQTSYLTPPMAPSIFYLKAIAPPSMRLTDMYWGVIPFICCQLVVLVVLFVFPEIATWAPKAMYGK
jgi:tripartite ATP-independent transporter DctM subunit